MCDVGTKDRARKMFALKDSCTMQDNIEYITWRSSQRGEYGWPIYIKARRAWERKGKGTI